jgi:Tfp pilus assembly protein PilX
VRDEGVSIVATVGMMLILSILGLVGVSLFGSASSLSLDYMHAQQSFYIAEAGMEWYLEQLQNDANWSDNINEPARDFAGGNFTITVSNQQTDSITVTSTGIVTGYENLPIQRKSTAAITRSTIFDAYNYAVYAGGKIDTANTENLRINGSTKEDATNFPSVDYGYYQGIASPGQDKSGNYTFNAGTYSGIWYVDGNVTINSSVTINGTVVATGNISMNGNEHITVNATSPYPALVTEGNFLFQNVEDITVNGLIYVGANASGNFLSQNSEDINFYGTILVRGNFNLQGTKDVTITYNSAILNNPPPGFSGTGGASTINVTSWNEVLS